MCRRNIECQKEWNTATDIHAFREMIVYRGITDNKPTQVVFTLIEGTMETIRNKILL